MIPLLALRVIVLFLSVVIVAGSSLMALAADLPSRAAARAPDPAIADNSRGLWDGFYVGSGVSLLSDRFKTYSNNSYNGDDTSQTIGANLRRASLTLQAGYNWQFDSFVTSIELDINPATTKTSSCRGSRDPATACGDSYYGTIYLSGESKYLGSLKARAGYTFANVLFYASGGLASLKSSNVLNVDCSTGCGATDAVAFASKTSASKTQLAFAWGGGVEYAFNTQWRVGADYSRFKSAVVTQSVTHSATYGPQVITMTTSSTYSLMQAKLIYAF